MTQRGFSLQINFANPLYVSTETEPDLLEVTFYGGNLFVSEQGIALELPTLIDKKSRFL